MISRNQQRNWETLLQVIGLRCLPEDIIYPQHHDGIWQFSFVVAGLEALGSNDFESLHRDCQGVPMIQDTQTGQASTLQPTGPERNIWFSTLNI